MNNIKKLIFRTQTVEDVPPITIVDLIEDNSDSCNGYYSFKVITNIDVTVIFTSDLNSVATYIPVIGLPLPPGYIGIPSDSSVTTSVDQGYMVGINATKDINPSPAFTSRIIVEIKNTATSETLGGTEFYRYHTNAVC